MNDCLLWRLNSFNAVVTVLVATDRPSSACGKGCHKDHPDRIPQRRRSGPQRLGPKLQQTRRQRDRHQRAEQSIGAEAIELLREILPKPGVIAFVVNQNSTSTPVQLQEMQEAAQALAQPLLILNAATEREIEEAFATMSREKVVAVVFGASVFYQVVADRLVALAATYAYSRLV